MVFFGTLYTLGAIPFLLFVRCPLFAGMLILFMWGFVCSAFLGPYLLGKWLQSAARLLAYGVMLGLSGSTLLRHPIKGYRSLRLTQVMIAINIWERRGNDQPQQILRDERDKMARKLGIPSDTMRAIEFRIKSTAPQ